MNRRNLFNKLIVGFFYCSRSQFNKSNKDTKECILQSKGDINYNDKNITSKNTTVKKPHYVRYAVSCHRSNFSLNTVNLLK